MRNGDWIQTYTGKKFYPLDPRPSDIDLSDIAHALALTCRFNGHCRKFYCVAQHCVLMAEWDLPGSKQWRLFHDAAEAYIHDVPRPVKGMLPGYKDMENIILSCIGDKFALGLMDHDDIGKSDLIMLSIEKRDLLGPGPRWELKLPHPPADYVIDPWGWKYAEERFLDMACEVLPL